MHLRRTGDHTPRLHGPRIALRIRDDAPSGLNKERSRRVIPRVRREIHGTVKYALGHEGII